MNAVPKAEGSFGCIGKDVTEYPLKGGRVQWPFDIRFGHFMAASVFDVP